MSAPAAIASSRLVRVAVLLLPYAWLVVFFLVPFLIVGKIALSEVAVGIPPYAPMLRWSEENVLTLVFNFGNFAQLAEDSFYLDAYLRSLRVAGLSALLCLAIGYPMAYAIARAPAHRRNLLLLLVVLPFWTSGLVRTYALIFLLRDTGLVNEALRALGLVEAPLRLLHTEGAVLAGLVYGALPFMVLPLYASLEKLDPALLEAAEVLGASPWARFRRVILPLSRVGAAAGAVLVFVPTLGAFLVPDLLGGGRQMMLGNLVQNQFGPARDWPFGAAVSMATTVLVLAVAVPWLARARAEDA